MLFAHETDASLAATAGLVNSAADSSYSGSDELATMEDLVAYLDRYEFTQARFGGEAEVGRVRTLRTRLRTWWDIGERDLASDVNAALREAKALPQLAKHDVWDWHWHAAAPDAPIADLIKVEAAMAFADVIRAGELDRLRSCASEDCCAVFIDLTRNRSKRYCDVGNCGNRANVAAYRARKAAAAPASKSR
ncbi:MAG: CGNR zinc finger domain-containing protein [Microbacteriaceae bacterium]